jgi:phage FluMu protein Com
MITINGKEYKELRCAKCQHFIIFQNVSAGILALQCPKCDYLNEFVFKYLKTEANDAMIKKDYQIIVRGEN